MDKKDLYFLPLGGAGEIGMNLNLYSYQGDWLMVDLGVTFVDKLGSEVAMPDIHYIEERAKRLKGLVLTHAHEDHIGAVPYLWERLGCPIYATPFTAEVVRKKLQDVGLAKLAPLHVIQQKSRINIGPFEIELIDLTHSIPEPSALAIRTPAGTILHTGDWKIDHSPLVGSNIDYERLKQIGDEGVLALVCDSTNVFIEGASQSEIDVRQSLVELVKSQKSKVIISCFASNVARLQTVSIIAKETGRKLALMGRSMHRMYEIAKQCGYLDDMDHIVPLTKLAKLPPEEVLVLCTGSQGESRAALTKIVQKRVSEVRLEEGDTVIFSSRVIPGNEAEIHALERKLKSQNIHVYTSENAFTHVSGHPTKADLMEMYQWVRPKILVPVHGEAHHLEAQASLGKSAGISHTVVGFNGAFMKLSEKGAEIIETVRNGRVLLDGTNLVPESSHHFKDRERLSQSGFVSTTIVLSTSGSLLSDPQITLCGVVPTHDEKDVFQALSLTIKETMKAMSKSEKDDPIFVREKVQQQLYNELKSLIKKTPVVIVHVVRLKAKG